MTKEATRQTEKPAPERTLTGDGLDFAMLDGEGWWGGAVRHGDRMPFTAKSRITQRLAFNLDGNQGCPVYVSSKGRYLWSDEPFTFECADGRIRVSEAFGAVKLSEGHGSLKGAYLAASRAHFPANGKTPHPLNFTAPQYNGWIEMVRYPTQKKVLEYADRILRDGMPPGVLMIDDFWYQHPGHWDFDFEAFPDPKAMVDRLHAQGFLVMLWVCPWITADTRQFKEFSEARWILRKADGQAALHDWWGSVSAALDLSHPDCFAWYQGALDRLVSAYGIDGFKFDGGDTFYYKRHDLSHGGRTPAGLTEDFGRAGLKYGIGEYRACWKHGGTHLLQRVRDKGHRWGTGGMADAIPTTLAQGLIGYPYSAPDMVGGGDIVEIDHFDQELFVRWAQVGTFFPIIQYSRLPERVLDKEHLPLCLDLIGLRKRLGDEFLALARHAAATGEPMLRHMAYEFPDQGFDATVGQFMVGPDILVAPVLEKGARAKTVAFPKGSWRGDDGSLVQGPRTIEVPAPLNRIPWFRRERA